ncbi:hypothetical protein H310_11796 [Aphanomyces invadans]|uniref:Uncharacterized protein n=1 Tax=Aphanomyces invadans TaxID=157072 RepID=A0A024TMC4_9STRA|nr:hypothetical protein H310_11796 [Aphanomyces invadans]ETV94472.1 hypothetical protein H310_11796 [Aphanomyces invadans]|eukprot:XP_008876787.1 hypothetical protein H310_11796 [Aphanomyces invadans]
MNRTSVQLAAIDRRLRRLAAQPLALQNSAVDRVLADCRFRLNLLRRKFRALVAIELYEMPASTRYRASQWLNDARTLVGDGPAHEDVEFSTLDGFLLAEDVALLDEFVVQVSRSHHVLDAAFATAFPSPSASAVETNLALVS